MLSAEELIQFTELAKKFEPSQLGDVKPLVQKHLHAVFQDINDGGRAAANEANKAKVKQLEDQATAQTAQLEAVKAELKELREKNPDAATQIRAAEEKLEQLKTKHKAEKDELKGQIANERHARGMADLIQELVNEYQIDPEYAGTVLVLKPEVRERIRVKEDGSHEVLQAGNKELTITPAEGRTAISHLAEELAGKVDDKWKVSNVRRGASFDGTSAGGPKGGEKYDLIRKNADEAQKQTGAPRAGHDRLTGKRPAAAT